MLPLTSKQTTLDNNMMSWKEVIVLLLVLLLHLALGFLADFSNHPRTQFVLNAME
jgi:hypothetical protein